MGGSEYSISWIMKNLSISDPNKAQLKLIQDLSKYTIIHQNFFGSYKYGLMKKPESFVWDHVSGTLYEFLNKYDLISLAPLFKVMFHTTGYE